MGNDVKEAALAYFNSLSHICLERLKKNKNNPSMAGRRPDVKQCCAAERLAFLLRNRDVQGSYLDPKTGYPD
jgi:hypothetical protein